MSSDITKDESGKWMGNDADSSHAAGMLNAMDTGQLVWTDLNRWGQHLPTGYHDAVTPDERRRRDLLCREREG